jgi:hypothetical protein
LGVRVRGCKREYAQVFTKHSLFSPGDCLAGRRVRTWAAAELSAGWQARVSDVQTNLPEIVAAVNGKR